MARAGDYIKLQLIAREILHLARQVKNPKQVIITKRVSNEP